jgi:hypothetical protein
MNTMYRFNIKITGHAPVARAAIEDALNRVWPLDFDCDENGEIEGVGDDVLCGSMDEHAMVDDFAAAVWRANGGPCEIDVTATCLEDLPHERYSRDDEDYYDWRAKRERDADGSCGACSCPVCNPAHDQENDWDAFARASHS